MPTQESGQNQGQAQAQMEGLATLLVLDDEIRKLSTLREFSFFTTNETHRLIPYHTAYLWEKKEFIGVQILAQSGTAELEIHAPINQWLKHTIDTIRHGASAKKLHQVDLTQENSTEVSSDSAIASAWQDTLPPHFLWCPLLNSAAELSGGLIFFRETPFTESEIKMLGWLIASYQYTWKILIKTSQLVSPWQKLKEKPYRVVLGIIMLTIIFFPIRLSVIGNGTVVPKSPVLINAPLQGVIKSFAVNPGQAVKIGQLLLTLEKTDLQATAEINKRDYLLTQSKLRTAINEGFSNKESRIEIPVLQAQLQIDKARLDYTTTLLEKADVTSPIAGIVIFDSKEDWVGQPVHTGERILVVANPEQVELKITIPVTDIIQLKIGDDGEFFTYGQLSSLSVEIRTLGYNAKLLPNKILAYQLAANFTDRKDIPQLGSQGTVRLYGHYVPLVYYLMRRPLQALRQTLGI